MTSIVSTPQAPKARIVFDACTVISLCNASALEIVFLTDTSEYLLGPITEAEAGSVGARIQQAKAKGFLRSTAPQDVPTTRYLALLAQYRLGDGETESLAAAEELGGILATDDGRARAVAAGLLGTARVTGSIGLLTAAVRAGNLTSYEAYAVYRVMQKTGSFLPHLEPDHFE